MLPFLVDCRQACIPPENRDPSNDPEAQRVAGPIFFISHNEGQRPISYSTGSSQLDRQFHAALSSFFLKEDTEKPYLEPPPSYDSLFSSSS